MAAVCMKEATSTKGGTITLKASSGLVVDFLFHGINSIIYQRGLYAPEYFSTVYHYGVPVLILQDDNIKDYLNKILAQITEWLNARLVSEISLYITKIPSGEVVETWGFTIDYENGESTMQHGLDKAVLKSIENKPQNLLRSENKVGALGDVKKTLGATNSPVGMKTEISTMPNEGKKDLTEIQGEIRDVMRQICSTVSFLPLLDGAYSFEVYVKANTSAAVPGEWEVKESLSTSGFQQVKLKSFSTSLHRVNTAVNFKISQE